MTLYKIKEIKRAVVCGNAQREGWWKVEEEADSVFAPRERRFGDFVMLLIKEIRDRGWKVVN